MSEAREEILANVRRALAAADTSPVTVPRSYRDAGMPDPGAMLDLFVDRVADYRATVVRCSAAEVEARIAEALPDGARVLVPDGLPWQVPGAQVDSGPAGLSSADLDGLDAVVTAATVGIATTGTIVLSHGPGEGRRAVTLVPDLHVCVVERSQVVATVSDAIRALDGARGPFTFVSGPSATSDIELDRVEGVHGPRRLEVLLV